MGELEGGALRLTGLPVGRCGHTHTHTFQGIIQCKEAADANTGAPEFQRGAPPAPTCQQA